MCATYEPSVYSACVKPKILTTIRDYSWSQFGADALAGVTVALVALPLSIAIAIASGAPPAAGLITAIVGGFLISLLGGSRVQIGGPTGAFIVVVYAIIHEHGYNGLLIATMMAGLILLLAGFMHAGRLIRHIPEPVIEGFTIGIAVVIAVSQLKDLSGMTGPELPAEFIPKLQELWAMRQSIDAASVFVGVSVLVAILILRRLAPRIPWLVLVVVLASVATALGFAPVETVSARYGALPDAFPTPSIPEISVNLLVELFSSALTIAFLAGIESLLSAIVADRMVGGAHRSNAELIAQGAANIASPLFGGLPATGAIARTATNVNAGGRTPVAGMIHALFVLLVLLAAAPLAGALVLPALAALLILTAWTMSEPHRWPDRVRLPKADIALMLGTAAMTVLADLTVAIAVGTTIGLALRLSRGEIEAPRWHTPFRWGGDKQED